MAVKMTRDEFQKKYGLEPFSGAIEVAQTSAPQQGNTGIKGLATGVGKSAVGLVQGVGQLGRGIQKGISGGIDALTGTKGFGLGGESAFDPGTDKSNKLTELATPRTTSESVGKFVGDVAQFAVPGGIASKATKGAGILTRMAAAGGSDALVQTAQQGQFNRNTIDTGIIGSLFPAASKLKEGTKIIIGSKAGSRVVNSLIKPVARQFSYGKNPGRAVAELGITANSLEDFASGISAARKQTGAELRSAAQIVPPTVRINASKALNSFDEAMQKAVENNDQSLLNRLQEARDAIAQIRTSANGKIVPTGTRILDDLDYVSGVELKQKIGDITKWTGQKTEDETVNGALTRAYGSIKQQLDDATRTVDPKLADKLKKLNERYADLTSADVAARNREALAQRANLISAPVKLGGSVGAITAIASGGAITPALLVGLGVAGIDKALGTVAAKTRIASWLASTPKEELRSLWKEAPWLRSALQAAFFEEDGVDTGPNDNQDSKYKPT